MDVELKLEPLNELLKQAKKASNYLHHPEMLTDPKVYTGVVLCSIQIYGAITAVEHALRADARLRWVDDHWEGNLEEVTS